MPGLFTTAVRYSPLAGAWRCLINRAGEVAEKVTDTGGRSTPDGAVMAVHRADGRTRAVRTRIQTTS